MQDNGPKLTSILTSEWVKKTKIKVLKWPSQMPSNISERMQCYKEERAKIQIAATAGSTKLQGVLILFSHLLPEYWFTVWKKHHYILKYLKLVSTKQLLYKETHKIKHCR